MIEKNGNIEQGVLEAMTAFQKMEGVNERRKNTDPCYGLIHFKDGSQRIFNNNKKYVFPNKGALKNSLRDFLTYQVYVRYKDIGELINTLIEEGYFEIVKLEM